MPFVGDVEWAVTALRAAGVVAAEDEAEDLVRVARDRDELAAFVARRAKGEPTAWIVGSVRFAGVDVVIRPGVYVPRWQSQQIAIHAASHLGSDATETALAIDLCTGSGAVGAYLNRSHPGCRVVAVDIDPVAVACARANGLEAYEGDLFAGVPADIKGRADVVTAVPPYVPERMVDVLSRDVVAHEPLRALLGGRSGLDVARRIVGSAAEWLRTGGALVVEVGVDHVDVLAAEMVAAAFSVHSVVVDGDGDPCGVCGLRVSTRDGSASSRECAVPCAEDLFG